MLFNSFPFLLAFLPAVAVAYFAVPHYRARLLLIVGASYYFYAYADIWFPALMAGSTAISYTTGRVLERAPRKAVLAAGIVGCLGLLAYFKYAAFAGGYAVDLVHVLTGRNLPHYPADVTITAIELSTVGDVPGVGSARFDELAREAKETCTVSRALAATEILVSSTLTE